jgi:hypothetical protein
MSATVAFELPWPWDGERFELAEIPRLTYITGPLGSGKTRFAMTLARHLPDATFVGLDRLDDGAVATWAALERDSDLRARVDAALAVLEAAGAEQCTALVALLVALEAKTPRVLIVDMVEQGLDDAAQRAVVAYLREHRSAERPLFLMTRSTSILQLDKLSADEAIILCPANHSPPRFVEPRFGAPGYDSVMTCIASPAVRARTIGLAAVLRPTELV